MVQDTRAAHPPRFEQVHDDLGTGGAIRLLNAGCGSGLTLQIAADRGAKVAGIAAAASMLAIAGTSLHRNAFRYLIATA